MVRPPSQAPSALATLRLGVVHRGTEGLRLAGDVHQPQLEVDHQHRAEGGHREHDRAAAPSRAAPRTRTRSGSGPSRLPDRSASRTPTSRPARRPARCRRPCRARTPSTKTGHRRLGQAADLGDGRGDVGVDGEQPAEPDRAGQQHQPGLAVAEEQPQLAATGRLRVPGQDGTNSRDQGSGHERRAALPRRTTRASRRSGRARSRPGRRRRWRTRGRASRWRPRGRDAPVRRRLAATSDATPK